MSLPNVLTILRISIIPLLVLVFFIPFQFQWWFASGLFCLAACTDILDGWLARHFRLTSRFGAFLDPVADKLLVSVTLILLVSKLNFIVLPAIVIVAREIVVSALREWMAELGKRASVAVSFIGKMKTAIQMLALVLLVAVNPQTFLLEKFQTILGICGYVLLYIAMGLTIWSMVVYLRLAAQSLREDQGVKETT